jgi:hypothetical protein
MTVPYLLADRPWFQVKKSNISGKYFCTTRLVFNERGHWISWQVLDNNEQPSIVFQREITYFDDYSSVSFQSLQNEKD